ncbi:cytidylate kinase family protein [Candidatus Roizmanbacteria bacterium]|nr:cytidylate kinase family protein [Candidatus Roizmanbacteria bacterium]
MDTPKLNYRNITVSGKIATGTSTLAKGLAHTLGWKRVNAGDIQREYDRQHGIHENKQGAEARPDEHEQEIEKMTKQKLSSEDKLIYEAWLSGFVAREISGVLRVLLICSRDAIRVDRVMNRDDVSLDEAKIFIQQREAENISKWKKLYGEYDFWNSQYFHVVIDTYSSGPLETLGVVLDKLGYQGPITR